MIQRIKRLIQRIENRIKRRDYRKIGYFPTRIGQYDFKLNFEHMGYWSNISKGLWEPETYTILSKFLSEESIYCDIGAWVGPTVIYASKKCKKVICFEPDPIAFGFLTSNIERNKIKNVSSFNVAISDKTSIQKMSSFGGTLGDSMTSLLLNNRNTSCEFDALVLDWNFVVNTFKFEKIDMVKIDIEGGEFKLIPRMETYLNKYKPIVYLSIHGPLLAKNQRKDNLQKIVNVMSCYKYCYNPKLQLIDINDLLNQENTNNFVSFIFKD